MHLSASLASLCSFFLAVSCKVYERCELARELVEAHEIPERQVATWVCIAYRESSLNTSAVNRGSGDHGLFQISDRWWCSPPGDGYACGISCAALEDDDIEDDVVCARRVFRAHQRISGDGFSAWAVYPYYCKDKEKVKKYVEGCFGSRTKGSANATESTGQTTETIVSPIVSYRYVFASKRHDDDVDNNKKNKQQDDGEKPPIVFGKKKYLFSITRSGFTLKMADD